VNLRVIPRTAVDRYLKAVRLPLDAATKLLPGRRTGAGSAAKLAVERADATARAVAGTVLGDPALREDARRRRAAASERQRAVKLRTQADDTSDAAEARVEERHDQAQRRRAQADTTAKTRRQRASEEHQQKSQRASAAEKRRREAAREAKAREDKKVDDLAPQARLEALDAKADAEAEREKALVESDEAARLGDAAARVKAARKSESA
jgi:colicin import membrane protein